MPLNERDGGAILNLVSSMIIVFGLPLGFYIACSILNPIDHLERVSSEIGEGFMRGVQRGINETALNELVKKLTNTVISGLNANDLEPVELPYYTFSHSKHPLRGQL